MPTIILQTVPPERSGQSAAINMILRMVGSAVGVQLAATIVTVSIGPAGAPTNRGYTVAFALATAAGSCGAPRLARDPARDAGRPRAGPRAGLPRPG